MPDNNPVLDIAGGSLVDAGHLTMGTIVGLDAAIRGILGSMGLSSTVQNWLFSIIVAAIVIALMNHIRYVIRGGMLLIVSMMAVEMIKPAFVAIGARLLATH